MKIKLRNSSGIHTTFKFFAEKFQPYENMNGQFEKSDAFEKV